MTKPMTAVAILDRQKALDRIDGDTDLLDILSVQFLSDLPPLVQAMDAVGRSAGLDEGVRALHTLKSCAASVGADWLSDLARQGELAAREGRAVDLTSLHQAVQDTVQAMGLLGLHVDGVDGALDAGMASEPTLTGEQCGALRRLLPLLEAADFGALDGVDALVATYPDVNWGELSRSAESMDFARAASWVRQRLEHCKPA